MTQILQIEPRTNNKPIVHFGNIRPFGCQAMLKYFQGQRINFNAGIGIYLG